MAQTMRDYRMEEKGLEKGVDVRALNTLQMIGNLEDNYFLEQPEHRAQLEFFQHATGISDRGMLKKHIISIAKEAYGVFPYPCIWAYQRVLEKATHDAEQDLQSIFLDVGSFIGIDVRQVIHSGMKKDNVIATDLIDDWAKLGDKLFHEEKVIPFIKGDIFDTDFLDLNATQERQLPIDLHSISSLSDLANRVRFITCNSVFHLFDEQKQFQLAKRLAFLLDDARSGSVVFGSHVGSGNRCVIEHTGERGMFTHSPESWKEMWEKIFSPTKAKIEVYLGPPEKVTHILGVRSMTMLFWSVTII